MDMQQPPKPEAGVVLSIDYNTKDPFTKLSLDQKLDATENNLAALLKKETEIKTAEDLFASIEANSEIYRQRLNETAALKNALNTLTTRVENTEILLNLSCDQQKLFETEQNKLKESLQLLKENQDTLHQKVDQTDNNQIELNKRIMELRTQFEALKAVLCKLEAVEKLQKLTNSKIIQLEHNDAQSQFQVRSLGVFVMGLIAGFLMWIHMHKA